MTRHGWRTRATTFTPLRSLARVAGRVMHPTGYHVAVLGPDGAGKSALIDGMASRLRPAFWRVSKRHLRPHLLRTPGAATATPHGRPPRGPLLSFAQAALWIADYAVGDAVSIYPALVRSTLVLFDRYADDLTVDPLRYRFAGPPWLARWVARTAPRPDLTLVLVADPGTLRARKREVSERELVRQIAGYRALGERADVVVIDAGRSPEAVLDRATEAVLQRLAGRTARRLGLDR